MDVLLGYLDAAVPCQSRDRKGIAAGLTQARAECVPKQQ
jgi:hypothetical protein